jgi:hypothetical protein
MTTGAPASDVVERRWLEPPLVEFPFDQYQRYRIVAELAEAARGAGPLRVLDIGGHHADFYGRPRRPIAEALPGASTLTVDLPPNPSDGYVRGCGDRLPVREASFDLVAAVDVLEHVPRPARFDLLDEAVRAARGAVVIAAPFFDERLVRAETLLSDFVERTNGYVQGQLREHRELGWPSLADTVERLEGAGLTVVAFAYGHLWRWLLMMLDKHALAALPGSRRAHLALDAAYNRRFFEIDRERPCYRHFLVASRDGAHPALARARARFGATGFVPEISAGGAGDEPEGFAARMLALAETHAANLGVMARTEPGRRDDQLRELAEHCANLERGERALRDYIDKLEREFRAVERSWTFRLRQLVRRQRPRDAR